MHLTEREQDVYNLLMDNHTNRQIAHKLGISTIAVADIIASLYRKLGAHDRSSARASYEREAQR